MALLSHLPSSCKTSRLSAARKLMCFLLPSARGSFLSGLAQCQFDALNAPADKLLLSVLNKLGGHSAISGRCGELSASRKLDLTTENLYERTKELLGQHQWEQVIQELPEQTIAVSTDWRLLWNAAWANFKLNKINSSVELFKKAINLTDNSKDESICLTFLGISEQENQDFDSAHEHLKKSLELRESTLTRKTLALALMQLNLYKDAEQVHLDGLQLEPTNKERLAAYGDFLLDVERTEEAEAIQRKLQELE